MPRGYYDFGSIESLLGANQLDTGEIFHALTGVGLLDGLGRTFFFDSFRYGLGGWLLGSSGTGKTPTIIPADLLRSSDVYIPPFSAYFYTGVTSGDLSYFARDFYKPERQRIGLEFGVRLNGACSTYRVAMSEDFGGGYKKRWELRLDRINAVIKIETTSGWVDLCSYPIPVGSSVHSLQAKVVVDFETGRYRRVIIGDSSYAVGDLEMPAGYVGVEGVLGSQFIAVNPGISASAVTLGYVRYTVDEP
ncbi:MAG: hypothetical protein AB1744_00940 [Candidatus Zixiibacteriota bacterium]